MQEKYKTHREESMRAMATMKEGVAHPQRLDTHMRRASMLIREGHFDFHIDRSVLENALSVLHALREADDEEDDDDDEECEAESE